MGKKILSIILSLAIIFGSFPAGIFATKAYAAETKYKVEIVSFARGAQADLRSSELLEARLFVSNDNGNTWQATDNYNGTPVTQLNYTWTNELSTYLYVYNAHNMYGINNTAGEKEIGTGRWSNSFTGTGFAWAAIYGANINQTDLVGTISVVVEDNSGIEIGRDEHEGSREKTGGSSYRPIYTYSGILMPNLTEDIKASAFGLFEGDTKNVLDMLGEAGIVHITCTACSVSGVEAVPKDNNEYISVDIDGNVTAIQPGVNTTGGDTQIEFTVTKKNCKFHQNSSGDGNIKVYIYKKPKTTTTATTLTLTNLDERCTYYIDGVEGRLVEVGDDDDITNDYIIFEGLSPNTDYTVMAKGQTSDTEPVYAYVYDRTKASLTGTIRVLNHTNDNTGGTLTDISDMYTGGKIVFRLNGDLANIETTRVSEGVYSAILSTGTFYPWYTLDGSEYIQGDQQLIVTDRNVDSTIHFYEVKYDLNGGSLEPDISSKTHISGEKVTASSATPTRQGYTFIGWKDQYGNLYKPGDVLTNSIAKPYLLEAQWEDAVNVYVNVEIDHTEIGGGRDYTEDKDDIRLRLVSAAYENAPYLQTGDEITITKTSHEKHGYSFTPEDVSDEAIEMTQYVATTATFVDVPNAFYSIVTDKPGYYIKSLENEKAANGDWTINVKMKYAPDSQNLNFAVKVNDAVPENLIPKAAIVKVLFWDKADNSWKIITQQEGMKPGVRVNFSGRTGSGSYPVWTNEPNGEKNPYYYRIVVTALVYPDESIVPMKNDVLEDLTKNNTDIYNVAIGNVANGQSIGALNGAYFVKNGNTISQTGVLDAVITATGYNVTFDAQGGKVNGKDNETVSNLYKVPQLEDYVPTREGGYVFDGWYKEASCTTPAVEGEYLTGNITLYAKWSEPLKISGNVTVDGTYTLDGNTHTIHSVDRANRVLVLLQKVKDDEVIDVASQDVEITYDSNNKGKGTFLFNEIEDNGDEYRIVAYSANYDSLYRNEPEAESYSGNKTDYNGTDFNAKFGDDTTAKIDTYLVFNPQSFPLKYEIDATAIGDGYRPTSAEMLVLYDDGLKGNNPLNWAVINQMVQGADLIGKDTVLSNGKGSDNYFVWNQKTEDGEYYDYSIKLNRYTPANGEEKSFNEDEEPFTVAYNGAARYDASRGQTQTLKAVLTPKEYRVIFDLGFNEVENDNVGKSMESYRKDEGTYETTHKWSYETEISATPERAGYEFKGWFIDKDDDKTKDADEDYVTKIEASVHNDVTLTAEWQELPGIYVDVVINHKEEEGSGYNNDQDKHNITFTVGQKDASIGGDFTEIFSKTINWNGSDNVAGYTATYDDSDKQTKYTAAEPTLKAEIDGKSYTVTAAKHGYRVENIESSTVDGKFRLKITLRYDPNNFDFSYSVRLDDAAKALSSDVKPKAVNVKVTSWYDTPYDTDFGAAEGTVNTAWYTITQQRESYQRVALNDDGEGTGTYPVWMHETVDGNQIPYYYRIEVVSYELKDGTIVPVNNLAANQPSTSNQYTTASGIYTATINTDSACVDPDGTGGTELEGAYYGDVGNNNNGQVGSVEAVVSINTYGITLDPAEGKFSGKAEDENMTLNNLIQMPDISEHVPTKQGYAFSGWTWKDGSSETANSVNPLSKGDLMTKDLYLTANWTPISYEIKYVKNGGNLPENVSDTRTYTITDERFKHPVPTKKDYVFKGWYDNSNFNGTPEEYFEAGQTGDKVYYAKWEYDNVSLTIHKNFKSGTKADPKQPFIFRIQNSEKGIDLKVCIEGAGYVVVKDLPRSATNYTVTEVTGYSWRYTPDSNTKTVDLSKTNNSVTFTNERTSDNWINAISRKTNRFN